MRGPLKRGRSIVSNCAGRGLLGLPEEVLCQCQQLTVLDLSDNPELQLIGDELCRLSNLRELAARGCGLQQLPSELLHLRKLTSLDLSNNKLSSLPSSIWSLVQLKDLNVSRNSLTNLPELDSPHQSLLSLDASENCLVALPRKVHLLQSLKTLDLGSNSLDRFPDDIWRLTQLESLSIRKNAFKQLPTRWWRQLTLLKLDASNNFLSSLPHDMWRLPALQTLDVSGNSTLTKVHVHLIFHERIRELAVDKPKSEACSNSSEIMTLAELRCFNGDFVSHAAAVERRKALLTLNLTANELELSLHNHGLTELDDKVLDDISSLNTLITVDLSNNDLEKLPAKLWTRREIELVNLSSNKRLQNVPAEVCTLSALKSLDAGGCSLSTLPPTLGQLSKLESLRLGGNVQLQTLPAVVFTLSGSLQEMGIGGCGLSSLPSEIAQLTHLKVLDVSGNELSTLPSALRSLQKLEVLRAGNNKLSVFPEAVLGLRCLAILDLSNKQQIVGHSCFNSITELPVNLLELQRLQRLDLGLNPMVLPPAAICDQGVEAVRAYLSDISTGRATLCLATVSLLGETGAGKTSLVLSFELGAPRTTAFEDRTRVMEQRRLHLSTATDDSGTDGSSGLMVFNDFGGHAIYQTVLPVLLPPRGIALLVYDVTQPEPEHTVDKWLTTTLAASPGTRLLIVGTHCDQLPATEGAATHGERAARFYHRKMAAVQEELEDHIREVQLDVERCSPDDYPATFDALQRKLAKLQLSLRTLRSSAEASLPPLVVSCKPRDHVESAGLDEVRKALASMVSAPAVLPASWCRLVKDLLEPADDAVRHASYLTLSAVEQMFSRHFPSVDDRDTLTFILVYLTEASQVIWLKDHPKLSTVVFHRVDHVIDIFKAVLCHDDLSCWGRESSARGHYADEVAKYKEGFLSERLLYKLLEPVVSTDCKAGSLVELLIKFRLISLVNGSVRSRAYVIPSKLPEQPPAAVAGREGRVSMHAQLSFFGSIIPLAFFETSQVVVLQHADQPNVTSQASCWRDGVLFRRNGVRVTCQRVRDPVVKHGSTFDIRASSSDIRRLWSVAQPLFHALAVHLTTSWKGAWYNVLFLCPACKRSGHTGADAGSWRFELDYGSLEDLLLSGGGGGGGGTDRLDFGRSLVRPDARVSPCGHWRCRDDYSSCPKCDLDIPCCLLSVCSPNSITDEDMKRVETFLAGWESDDDGRERIHYHLPIDRSVSYSLLKELLRESEGVGMICGPELRATGFRIGSRYLLTAKHVVEKIIREDCGSKRSPRLVSSSEREVFVIFKYDKNLLAMHDSLMSGGKISVINLTEKQWQAAGLTTVTFTGAFVLLEGVDAAVLELDTCSCSCAGSGCKQCGQRSLPRPLHCASTELNLTCIDRVHVVGHPDGRPKQLDMQCNVVRLSFDDRLTLKSSGSASIADANLLLYECTLYEGASGAPVLAVLPGMQQPAVIAMHVCGFPDAAAGLSQLPSWKEQPPRKRNKSYQGGVRLDVICKWLKEHHSDVYNDIINRAGQHEPT